MRPGDQNERWNSEAHRGESEIAFVHSDGRIDRFRPLVSAVSNRRESSTSKKQHNNKSEVKLCSQEPRNPGTYQPMCVKPDSVPARYLGADIGDTVSLGYCDIPPPYEEALEMPVAAHGESAKKKNDQGIIVGSKLETDYYNIEISKQTTKSPD
uniref:Uncharacterized protein n=1 Tax=Arion vulgaris TaxID=1028688 RepID=A0A0B7BIV1_9EUPU